MRFVVAITALVMSLMLTGCNQPMPELKLEPEINSLFTAIQNNQLDAALAMYSDEFFKGIPKQYWRAQLTRFNEVMGPLEKIRIRNKQSDTRFRGKFFVFQLDSMHKGGKKARHILTFVLPVDGGEVQLVGHKISAKGL